MEQSPEQRRFKRAELLLFVTPLLVIGLVLIPVSVTRYIGQSSYAKVKAEWETQALRDRVQLLKVRAQLLTMNYDLITRQRKEKKLLTQLRNGDRKLMMIRHSTYENPCVEKSHGIACP